MRAGDDSRGAGPRSRAGDDSRGAGRPRSRAGRVTPLALALALAACRDRAPPADPGGAGTPRDPAPPLDAGLVLEVGPGVRADLRLLPEPFYVEAELEPLFARLARAGDDYCRQYYRLAPRDEARMAAFVGPPERYFAAPHSSKWNTRAGCWNFYQANDRTPWLDFDLVRRLFPAAGYDCYAIGFPQPYIMHNHLGCRSLTLVDFDWRIHDAHRRLLARFRAGQITDRQAVRRALAEIPFQWVARGEPPPAEGGPSAESNLCEDARAECEEELQRFQGGFAALARIRLGLAALHELAFDRREPGALPVIYLSNAMTDGYTSGFEFLRFCGRLAASLADGEGAVLIQHAGARPDFAIYHLTRGARLRVTARCHDFFRAGRPRHDRDRPTTWLDLLARPDPSTPGCHDLLPR